MFRRGSSACDILCSMDAPCSTASDISLMSLLFHSKHPFLGVPVAYPATFALAWAPHIVRGALHCAGKSFAGVTSVRYFDQHV